MKFGKEIYNPSLKYGKRKQEGKQMAIVEKKNEKLINQRKLNEKFSF